jgi:ferredoxin-NADP reductase
MSTSTWREDHHGAPDALPHPSNRSGGPGRTTAMSPKRPPPAWQDAEVLTVITQNEETATLRLRLPDPAGFLAGQYYNVRLPVAGRPRQVQRAYSIGSSPRPDPSVIELTVKRMEGGLVSPLLVDEIPVGSSLAVRGPYGSFTWKEGQGGPLLLIAAGSGVVPLVAIARFAESAGADTTMQLLFCSKSYDTVIYRDEIARLCDRAWFETVHTFTRSPHDLRAAFHRRIDRPMIQAALADRPLPRLAYLCGPPTMVDTCRFDLVALGMDPDQIRTEKYD